MAYFTFDQTGHIVDANQSGAILLGVASRSLIGKPLSRFVTQRDRTRLNRHCAQVLNAKAHRSCELKMLNYDDVEFDVQLDSIAIEHPDDTGRIRTAVTDITGCKQAEKTIRASLQEKEVLLREIYHRTKNNMQIVCGLISLQAAKLPDETTRHLFIETRHRIQSMALVHEKLYRSQNLSRIDLKGYVEELSRNLLCSYQVKPDQISLRFFSRNAPVLIDTAVPIGLVLNELVSNALKHAFPAGRRGEITIALKASADGELELRIADNGIGLPAHIGLDDARTLGLRLVSGIVGDQLRGTLELDRSRGTEFRIRFKEVYEKRL